MFPVPVATMHVTGTGSRWFHMKTTAMKSAILTLASVTFCGFLSIVFIGCGNKSESSDVIQHPKHKPVVDEPVATTLEQPKNAETTTGPRPVNADSIPELEDDTFHEESVSEPEITVDTQKNSELEEDPQNPETVQAAADEQKPDPDELMRKALEHLAEKRRAKQEAESAAKNAAEDALRQSRERAVKELISELVSIPGKSFKMGRTEVSQSQWEGVMGNNPSYFKYSDHPVDSVSWYDAQAFIKTLNEHPVVKEAGIVFRLPTPEEWEYACRAGSTGEFGLLSSGKEGNAASMAWYIPNTSNGDTTRPVGKKMPNAWGLYDMHGNVKEWTSGRNADYGITRGGSFACWDYEVTAKAEDQLTERKERYRTVGIRLCADGR